MIKPWRMCGCCAAILLSAPATVALADWDPTDPHKMHYPQLPDATGWDVKVTPNLLLADDWLCTGSGPVTDIHFWGSWRTGVTGAVNSVWVGIFSDVPAVGQEPSHPGTLLWNREFSPTVRPIDPPGDQGWYDPTPGAASFQQHDHTSYLQYNITGIPNPFVQQEGTIYWLALQAYVTVPEDGDFGWKTSLNHFNDDAAVGVWTGQGPVPLTWNELIDPVTAQSLDLSFVIVPEPASLIAALGAMLLGGRKRASA